MGFSAAAFRFGLPLHHWRQYEKNLEPFGSRLCGGLYWTRTSDPIDVNDVLYQLSQQTMSS